MPEDINFERRNALNAELAQLMGNLAANTSSIGDWKIIKIYEARMKGEEDPYDFNELAEQRQATRVRINEIQEELKNLPYQEESEEEVIDEEVETEIEEDVDEEVTDEVIEEENEVETDEEPSDDVEE